MMLVAELAETMSMAWQWAVGMVAMMEMTRAAAMVDAMVATMEWSAAVGMAG